MSGSVDELALAYARLGLREWRLESPKVRQYASAMGAPIATREQDAMRAVENPFDPDSQRPDRMYLLPMPRGFRKVTAAFFAPWAASQSGSTRLAFDLVVLRQSKHIAFRFEPASKGEGTHGYDHVQLSESLGRGQVKLDNPLSPLPVTYPAFPIPAQDAVTRLLALVVTMHGYPLGAQQVLQRAFGNRLNRRGLYLKMTKAMLHRAN